jgi:hypothetical protein
LCIEGRVGFRYREKLEAPVGPAATQDGECSRKRKLIKYFEQRFYIIER